MGRQVVFICDHCGSTRQHPHPWDWLMVKQEAGKEQKDTFYSFCCWSCLEEFASNRWNRNNWHSASEEVSDATV